MSNLSPSGHSSPNPNKCSHLKKRSIHTTTTTAIKGIKVKKKKTKRKEKYDGRRQMLACFKARLRFGANQHFVT